MVEYAPISVYDGRIDLADRNNPRTKVVGAIRPGSRVLEVGCATGFMGEFLVTQRNCTVRCVEIEEEAARLARGRGLDVVLGNIEDHAVLAQVAGTYDFVLFGDVLEHLVHPARVIASVAPLMAADGHLLASIPNVAHWSVRWRLMAGQFRYTRGGLLDENHLRFFERRTVRQLFEHGGLRVRSLDSVYAFPIPMPLPHAVRRGIVRAFPGLFTWQFVVDAVKP